MVLGFGCLQLLLDLGERRDWFDSSLIVALAVLAVVTLVGFVIRELLTLEPILDLTVFGDRNFGVSSLAILLVGPGVQLEPLARGALHPANHGLRCLVVGPHARPGRRGHDVALMIAGRLVSRMDQRLMLPGRMHPARASPLWMMTHVTSTMDFWSLAVAALRPGLLPGVHLRAAAGAGPRHRPDGAPRQCDGGLQHAAEHRRQHRCGARHHAARAPQSVPSGGAREPRQYLEPRDGRAAPASGPPTSSRAARTRSRRAGARCRCCIARR